MKSYEGFEEETRKKKSDEVFAGHSLTVWKLKVILVGGKGESSIVFLTFKFLSRLYQKILALNFKLDLSSNH